MAIRYFFHATAARRSRRAAQTTEDRCAGTLTIVQFGQNDLEKIIAEGREKLGGPVFVIPLPGPQGPDPVGPGPTNDDP